MKTLNQILAAPESFVGATSEVRLLRKIVVALAVSGRLHGEDSGDVSAKHAQRALAEMRQSLIASGRLRRPRALPQVGVGEVPVEHAQHAIFERLQDVATIEKGKTGIQGAVPGKYPLVATGEGRATADHCDFDGFAAIIPLVSSSGHGHASIKRLHYQEGQFALGTILCAVSSIDEQYLSTRFLYEYLTVFKDELLVAKMMGTANVTLTLNRVGEVPVPILPPSVQLRVGELMAAFDALESAHKQEEASRSEFVISALLRLVPTPDALNGDSPRVPQDAAELVLHSLNDVTHGVDDIRRVREAVLDLAVRGCLVPQDSSEDPASAFLLQVQDAGAGGRSWESVPCTGDAPLVSSPPWPAPAGWTWSRLGELCTKTGSGSTPRGGKSVYSSSGVPFLRSQNVHDDGLILEDIAYIAETIHERMGGTAVRPGDLLLNITGGSIGRCALVPQDFARGNVSQHVAIIRPAVPVFAPYMHSVIRSPYFQSEIRRGQTGAGREGLPKKRMDAIWIPVPPSNEQERIVDQLDRLRAVFDGLQLSLRSGASDRIRLLEALLGEARRL